MTISNNLQKFFTDKFGVITADFDNITINDFVPALEEAIEVAKDRVEKIIQSNEKPTFQNTIEALDFATIEYNRVDDIIDSYNNQYKTDEFTKIYEEEIIKIDSEFSFFLASNKALFPKIKIVKETSKNLNTEQRRLLDQTYDFFVDKGSLLSSTQQEKIKNLNEKLAELGSQFSTNIAKAMNSVEIHEHDEKSLRGIPEDILERAKKLADNRGEDGWIIKYDRSSAVRMLASAHNREFRKKLWLADTSHCNSGEFDNTKNLKEISSLRIELANILGYKTFSEYKLRNNMLKTPQQVTDFIDTNFDHAVAASKQEFYMVEDIALKDDIDIFEPWDYGYYSKTLKKEKFNFDDEEMRDYLELENVQKGLFQLIQDLYDIELIENDQYPTPENNPDIKTYEVFDTKENRIIGLMYSDLFKRQNKYTGAWMSTLSNHSVKDGEENLPVCGINMNAIKGEGTKPTLLTTANVKTLHHEMGHALHVLLSKVNYPSLSGTLVPRDFVELPSQIMEDWMNDIDYYSSFAKHHKTGETIPRPLLEAREKAQLYGGGNFLVSQLGLCKIDMAYNNIETAITKNAQEVEDELQGSSYFYKNVHKNIKSVWFPHPFASEGYASQYYSYLWSQCLDYDAFEEFKKNGLRDKKTAQSFRTNILEKGNSANPMDLYVAFKGQKPDPAALLKRNGLMTEGKTGTVRTAEPKKPTR